MRNAHQLSAGQEGHEIAYVTLSVCCLSVFDLADLPVVPPNFSALVFFIVSPRDCPETYLPTETLKLHEYVRARDVDHLL
jgi:hypothetical protein